MANLPASLHTSNMQQYYQHFYHHSWCLSRSRFWLVGISIQDDAMYVARSAPFGRNILTPLTGNLVRSKGGRPTLTRFQALNKILLNPYQYPLWRMLCSLLQRWPSCLCCLFFRSQAYMVRSGDNIFRLTKNYIQTA